MSRLIDADVLNFVLEKNFGHTDGASVMKQLIDEQPTAYDVHKIAEQLMQSSRWEQNTYDEDGYSNDDSEEIIGLYEAIDIILGGEKE